jgi:hypothetical protein
MQMMVLHKEEFKVLSQQAKRQLFSVPGQPSLYG